MKPSGKTTMRSAMLSLAGALLIVLAWLISPQIIWIRNLLMLGASLVIPLARIGAAPLALAWDRHR